MALRLIRWPGVAQSKTRALGLASRSLEIDWLGYFHDAQWARPADRPGSGSGS